MPTVLQFRRGTTAQNNNFTGSVGEISIDTDKDTLRLHDGSTAGGVELVTTAATQTLTNKSISGSQINSGTIPDARIQSSGVTQHQADLSITESQISDLGSYITASSTDTLTNKSISGSQINSGTIPDARIQSSGVTQHQTSITGTGALNAGSITSGFGAIDIGTDTVTLGGILNANADGVGNIGASGDSFNTVFAKATSAQYADVAEKYESDAGYEPGTVISIGGEKEVTQSTAYADSAIAGVVSTNPAYLMNSNIQASISIDLALTGRVPCRVVGNISKGDVLTSSSTPGVATKLASADFIPGCILGKALEDYNSNDPGVIEVLVGKA